MAMTNKRLKTLCLAILVFVGSGCAALTIDVDVYKGPLANHEKVQLEQMAVMAVAAKPLLEALCIKLEGPDDNDDKTTQKKCDPKTLNGNSNFDAEGAKRVYGILSLYEDQPLREFSDLIKPFKENLKNYIENFHVVRPIFKKETFRIYRNIWKKIRQGMHANFTEDHPLVVMVGDNQEDKKEVMKYLNELMEAYGKLIRGDADLGAIGLGRDQDAIYEVHQKLFKKLESSGEENPLKYDLSKSDPPFLEQPYTYENAKPIEKQTSANSEFRQLPTLANVHAKWLFPESDANTPNLDLESKITFIEQIDTISQTFLSARKNLEDLLRLSLKVISLTYDSKIEPSYPVGNIREAAARFASQVINPKYLFCALENTQGGEAVPKFKRLLNNNLRLLYSQKSDEEFQKFEYKKPEKWVLALLRNTLSMETASAHLLKVHEIYKAVYKSDSNKDNGCDEKRYEWTPQREFGITTGPVDPPQTDIIKNLGDAFAAQVEAVGGLDRGRLAEGLHTLIENYLNRGRQEFLSGKQGEVRSSEELALIDALVRFGQKVISISNTKTLLGTKESRQEVSSKDLDAETLVLQSIGNSILVQANELTEFSSHKDALEKSGPRERHAVSLAYSSNPSEVLNDLINGINGKTKVHKKQKSEYVELIGRLDSEIQDIDSQLSAEKKILEDRKKKLKIQEDAYELADSNKKLFQIANVWVNCSKCKVLSTEDSPEIGETIAPSVLDFQQKLEAFVSTGANFTKPGEELKNKIETFFQEMRTHRHSQSKKNLLSDLELIQKVKRAFVSVDTTQVVSTSRLVAFQELKGQLMSLGLTKIETALQLNADVDELYSKVVH